MKRFTGEMVNRFTAADLDVHQHLWPETYLDALRARREPPYLDGWVLHLAGEPAYAVDPADHDATARLRDLAAADRAAVLAHSSPLGVEDLPRAESSVLLEAWHDGAVELGERSRQRVRWWAALPREEAVGSDAVRALERLLSRGAAGLQVPATWLQRPQDVSDLGPLLRVLEEADRPLLVHPGPAAPELGAPGWWAPVVDYVAQMARAWWVWHLVGRPAGTTGPRVCFAAGAGLAPVHQERLRARGGDPGPVDPNTFVELSGYGPQAFDALLRVLGVDVLVAASDHPYGRMLELPDDPAAARAVRRANPRRLMDGGPR